MRKICRNRKAVSNVVGTMLMLAIIVPAIAGINIMFTQMMNAQRVMMESQIALTQNSTDTQRVMMESQINLMQRFMEYMDEVYFHFSPEYNITNHAPNITDEYPSNRAVNVTLQPTCYITASDEDGNNLVVSFSYYEPISQSWEKAVPIFCESNTTINWKYENANLGNVTYYWRVAVYDGITVTTSEIYSFRTAPSEAPIP